jgi:ferredoxin--NADP+ reductase
MTRPGTPERPLRVAIIGSGPAAFYATDHLLRQKDLAVRVDMLERLPTPYGLVRGGVAPDHLKIKSVIAMYEKTAALPGFRFFGNVAYGGHVSLDDLRARFDAVVFATGAPTDRRMGIPGEDLAGSHSATEFVAWYNGHPDFRERSFDLSQERVAVVGVGNVAIDVARILCLGPDEFDVTDMAHYAIDALRESHVREVWILGRRGPVQAAFTTNEVRELGEMKHADVVVKPEEVALDPVSQAELAASGRPAMQQKVDIVTGFASRPLAGKPRRLHLRFLVSPVAVLDDGHGRVAGLELVRNRLVAAGGGSTAQSTGETEVLPVGMVFRSVGYRGIPLPGLPFDERRGVLPNQKGRVTDPSGAPVTGVYASGWIKRGPTGVIGNNKADSVETVNTLLADLAAGALPAAPAPDEAAFEALLRERQPRLVTFADWQRLDAIELARGKAAGRPRWKLTSVPEMLAALEGD